MHKPNSASKKNLHPEATFHNPLLKQLQFNLEDAEEELKLSNFKNL